MTESALHALARDAGLAATWEDAAGAMQSVAPEDLRAILECLGLPCATVARARESRARLAEENAALARGFVTADATRPLVLPFPALGATARLRLEDGTARDLPLTHTPRGTVLPGIAETGYHTIEIDGRESALAVCPPRALGLGDLAGAGRLWGTAVQVYALRGSRPAGFGDFGALAEFAATAAGAGADALAISPVHALFAADARRYSPYAPSTRLFLNGLLGDPGAVFPEFRAPDEPDGGALIDWEAAAPARLAALRGAWQAMRARAEDARWADFHGFCAAGGADLERHACFEALHAKFHAETGAGGWQDWPAAYRDVGSEAVAEFASAHAEELGFHSFLQWIADRSLGRAQDAALAAGMAVGLIADLAVGMDGGGSHAWSRPGDLLQGLGVGAPPDLFQPRGQDWGIAAFSPQALRRDGFRPFLRTLRAAMARAGGVRIDHAMGLRRLWVSPHGTGSARGAYLAYPFEDMMRLLALESRRARAVVVGEDLGTVPGGFREAMRSKGMMGMRVLWFERDEAGGFTPPHLWQPDAVALTATHDLPTVAGWWTGRDIDWSVEIGAMDAPAAAAARAGRAQDRARLWEGMGIGAMPEAPGPAADAAIGFVADTPCRLAIVPVEDLLGEVEQPNLPGTTTEHPNWRRRLPGAPEPLFARAAVRARTARLEGRKP